MSVDEAMPKPGFEVIIIGGSYSGLAAGMALGRALRRVLIIDSGMPCNRQTPHSHNFITQDGRTPKDITRLAKRQVQLYDTVSFVNGLALTGIKTAAGFEIGLESGETFTAKKLIVATGIRDIMPDINGFSECWGISVLHCPYCHGYELEGEKTGILGNGEPGFEFSKLISNWTNDIVVFTDGVSTLTTGQSEKLMRHGVRIEEAEIRELVHKEGHLQQVVFKSGEHVSLKVLYARTPFVQHSNIPESLGCELTVDGYIKVDPSQKTTVNGVYACGDNATRIRTVANAVAMGTTAGMMLNKEMIEEDF